MTRLNKLLKPHVILLIGMMLFFTQGCGGTGADLPQVNQQTASSEATSTPTTNGTDPTGSNDPSSNTSTGASSGQTQDTAVLSWVAPSTSSDGTPLTDLSGFRVYYGQTAPLSKAVSQQIAVDDITTYTVSGLQPGLYYFAVTAVDFLGNESDFSETVSKNLI